MNTGIDKMHYLNAYYSTDMKTLYVRIDKVGMYLINGTLIKINVIDGVANIIPLEVESPDQVEIYDVSVTVHYTELYIDLSGREYSVEEFVKLKDEIYERYTAKDGSIIEGVIKPEYQEEYKNAHTIIVHRTPVTVKQKLNVALVSGLYNTGNQFIVMNWFDAILKGPSALYNNSLPTQQKLYFYNRTAAMTHIAEEMLKKLGLNKIPLSQDYYNNRKRTENERVYYFQASGYNHKPEDLVVFGSNPLRSLEARPRYGTLEELNSLYQKDKNEIETTLLSLFNAKFGGADFTPSTLFKTLKAMDSLIPSISALDVKKAGVPRQNEVLRAARKIIEELRAMASQWE